MNILIVHQNFPGQFGLLAMELAKNSSNRVVAIGDYKNLKGKKFNVAYEVYPYVSREPSGKASHHYLTSFERAIRRGQDVVRACQHLRSKGFWPDIVLGHPGWGELLFIKEVFPSAKLVAYFEYFYRYDGGDVGFDPEFPAVEDVKYKLKIRNSTQLHALNDVDAGYSPSMWQRSTYPQCFQKDIAVIPDGFEFERYAKNPKAFFEVTSGKRLDHSHSIVTYVSRNLEPYRGFHTFMRALPDLQWRLPQTHFVIVGGNSVSYGNLPEKYKTWKEQMLIEVGAELDPNRTHFVGKIPYERYLDLLKISKLHIYLTYPFVLSWSMLEAMACGTPVLASATEPVQEVLVDGVNGRLFDFFDKNQLVEQAVEMIDSYPSKLSMAAQDMLRSKFSFQNNSLNSFLNLLQF